MKEAYHQPSAHIVRQWATSIVYDRLLCCRCLHEIHGKTLARRPVLCQHGTRYQRTAAHSFYFMFDQCYPSAQLAKTFSPSATSWTSRGHRCLSFSLPVLAFILIASRVPTLPLLSFLRSSTFINQILLTHAAVALSLVNLYARKSPLVRAQALACMHSARVEPTTLTSVGARLA